MKVLFVAGSYPPETCGIGDYVARLCEVLARRGVDTGILTGGEPGAEVSGRLRLIRAAGNWRAGATSHILAAVREYVPDLVHLQYPGFGYGHSLLPQFLAAFLPRRRRPLVLTLHEFAIAHYLRKMSIVPMLLSAGEVILTTEAERDRIVRRYGWIRPALRRAHVMPIGSNLPDEVSARRHDPKLFSYWGMFHRGKGVELLLQAFALALKTDAELRLRLAGALRDKDRVYVAAIERLAADLGIAGRVEMCFDQPGDELAVELQQSCAVLLPFADGATFRRTTLVTALRLGLPVVTTRGACAPRELVDGRNVLFAGTAHEMSRRILALSTDPELRRTVGANARLLGTRFEWDEIAEKHIDLYRHLLRQ